MRIVAICNSRVVVIGFSHGKNSVLMTCSQKFSKLTCTSTCRIWHHNERRRREGVPFRGQASLCAEGERFDLDVTMVSWCVVPHSRCRTTLTLDTVAKLLRNLFNTPGKWAVGILRSAFERGQCGKRRYGVNFSDAASIIPAHFWSHIPHCRAPYQWFNLPYSTSLPLISMGLYSRPLTYIPIPLKHFFASALVQAIFVPSRLRYWDPSRSISVSTMISIYCNTSLLHCISLLPFIL